MNGNWNEIERAISQEINRNIRFTNKTSVSGGCINQCWKVTDTENKHWFIKTNEPKLLDMFIAEAQGLDEINKSQSIHAPKSICSGNNKEFSYLVLEHLSLKTLREQSLAGIKLAQMHQYTATHFGWKRDNTIGSTPQPNRQHLDWVSFWKDERLLFQLNLALEKGYPHKAFEDGLKLADRMPVFFNHYQPLASLLHGDLWGGNCAQDNDGNPVIFDPAVYYGDRETDIAMTELFGGFNNDFYAAYNEHYALDAGYQSRKTLYNLYHILNHFNLFGGGYASQAANMTKKLLAEIY